MVSWTPPDGSPASTPTVDVFELQLIIRHGHAGRVRGVVTGGLKETAISDDPAREKKVRVRRAVMDDLEEYAQNVQSVAAEGRYIFTEEVTPERKEAFRKSFRDRDSLVLVAEIDEGPSEKRNRKVVGSLTLERYGHVKKARHVRVLGMHVIRGYRGMGIGTRLMGQALKWARRKPDVEKIVLGVFSSNRRALHLYQKFGFEVEGVRKRQYYIDGRPADEIDMALFLK